MAVQSITALTETVSSLIDGLSDSTVVTDAQLKNLSTAFSTSIYNSGANTTKAIQSQIDEFQQLMDALQSKMDRLYSDQKKKNNTMAGLLADLNDKTHEVTSNTSDQLQKQKDEVASVTDSAFKSYMKGEITKEEIPIVIASKLKNSSLNDGEKLESSLKSMDAMGTKISSLCDDIADLLDQINVYKSQYKTTSASKKVLEIMLKSVPEHNTRADITNTVGNYPLYSVAQTERMNAYMAVLKTATTGDIYRSSNAATANLGRDLGGTIADGKYTAIAIHTKDQLNALTGKDLEAALDPTNHNYSILEKLYLMGMKDTDGGFIQASYALNYLYSTAGIGFNVANGLISGIPKGHDAAASGIFADIINQYNQLWGGYDVDGKTVIPGGAVANIDRTDPIGYTQGDVKFEFATDRNNDGILNDASEFLGATGQGWNELVGYDTNGDKKISGTELDGLMVLAVNQDLKNGGDYSFMNASMAGINQIDLSSYTTAGAFQDVNQTNIVGTFGLTVNNEAITGQHTEATDQYLTAFFSHTYGEKVAFSLDTAAIASAFTDANKVGSNEEELALLKLIAANTNANISTASEVATSNVDETEKTLEDGLNNANLVSLAPSSDSANSNNTKKLSQSLDTVFNSLF